MKYFPEKSVIQGKVVKMKAIAHGTIHLLEIKKISNCCFYLNALSPNGSNSFVGRQVEVSGELQVAVLKRNNISKMLIFMQVHSIKLVEICERLQNIPA